jgi:hypothetical protein
MVRAVVGWQSSRRCGTDGVGAPLDELDKNFGDFLAAGGPGAADGRLKNALDAIDVLSVPAVIGDSLGVRKLLELVEDVGPVDARFHDDRVDYGCSIYSLARRTEPQTV